MEFEFEMDDPFNGAQINELNDIFEVVYWEDDVEITSYFVILEEAQTHAKKIILAKAKALGTRIGGVFDSPGSSATLGAHVGHPAPPQSSQLC